MGPGQASRIGGSIQREIAHGRDSNAPREPSIDRGLYERGCDKGKGYRSVDLSDTAFLARCDLLNIRDRSRYQLIERACRPP
jgi:hypothetical protein